jgi:hypothetical protein
MLRGIHQIVRARKETMRKKAHEQNGIMLGNALGLLKTKRPPLLCIDLRMTGGLEGDA